MNIISDAFNFCFLLKTEIGKELDRFSAQNHPDLPEAYRSAVAAELRNTYNSLKKLKDNLGDNNNLDITRAKRVYYLYCLKPKISKEEGTIKYIEAKKNKLREKYGYLFFNHSNGRKEEKDMEFLELENPIVKPYKNRTFVVNGLYKGKFVFKVDRPLMNDDIENFHIWHRYENIDEYTLCDIPGIGIKFIKKDNLNDNVIFVLTPEQRAGLLRYLAHGDEKLYNRFVSLWKVFPEEIEYNLYNYQHDHGNVEYYIQYMLQLLKKGEK